MYEDTERLRAELQLMLAPCDHHIVINLQISLTGIQVLVRCTASIKVPCNLQRRSRGVRRLLSALPGVPDARFMQQIGIHGISIGEAQVVLGHKAGVAGALEC